MLIEQYQYTTTTPTYNFPHTLEDTQLPQRFLELSLRSIRNIPNNTKLHQQYRPFIDEFKPEDVTLTFRNQTELRLTARSLKPIPDKTPVVAIDVSSIKIGETRQGILLAIRGAIVWKTKDQYRYLRVGPFPFHITEQNRKEIYGLFRRYSFGGAIQVSPSSLVHMQTRMATLLERWLQMGVVSQSRHSLILWDGSLTAGTNDSQVRVMSQLLEIARNRLNTVLAFSKMSRLRINGHNLVDLIEKCTPPCLLEIDGSFTADCSPFLGTLHLLGDIFVAKLSKGNCAFRLDIDKKTSRSEALSAVQRLLGNDIVSESYPETLRLAHIYSTFTANEVIGIQRFLTQIHRLKIVTKPNIRRLLFGPFAKGPDS